MSQVENLLRPLYELYGGAIYASAAGITLSPLGAVIISNPSWNIPIASLTALWGAKRLKEGWRLHQYQRGLSHMPKFEMGSRDLKWSHEKLYLGMGFRWDQRHKQRIEQLRIPKNRRYVVPGRLYNFVRDLEMRSYKNRSIESIRLTIKRLTTKDEWWNPVAPLPPIGGNSAIHAVGLWEGERPVWEALSERVGHKLVLGTTRVGKTRLAELMIAQDIRRGDVVIVFDPKGDASLLKRMYLEAKLAGRLDDFIIFHLGFPEISWRYNPIGDFEKVTEVADRIAGQLPSEGNSRAFRDFVWRFVNVITRALVALGIKPDFKKLYRYASDIDSLLIDFLALFFDKMIPGWQVELDLFDFDVKEIQDKVMKQRNFDAVKMIEFAKRKELFGKATQADVESSSLELADIARALIAILGNEKSYFDKLVSSLYPLLEKLTTGQVGELISPDLEDIEDQRPVFDWMEAISRKAVVYVGLDSLSIPMVAATVGASMFADITSKAGRIYKHGTGYGFANPNQKRKISVHADEFNELIGDEFIPLLNKAGGAGFQVTVYTQTWSDVEAKIGSAAKAEQIGGNLNTLIMLRVKNKETAEILTNQVEEVQIPTVVASSGVSDKDSIGGETSFVSKNEDRIQMERLPVVSPSDIVQLPKGQAFALLEGGQLWKIRLPLPDESDDKLLPDSLSQLVRDMRIKYEHTETHWDSSISKFRHDWQDMWSLPGREGMAI
ncbi:MAG: type IV conjugative transfer system coupling protein TraD [Thiotrichales bacterium]|nr:type IV conjugative transfer system coupling protein TraD [Thiotrichales bacterium]